MFSLHCKETCDCDLRSGLVVQILPHFHLSSFLNWHKTGCLFITFTHLALLNQEHRDICPLELPFPTSLLPRDTNVKLSVLGFCDLKTPHPAFLPRSREIRQHCVSHEPWYKPIQVHPALVQTPSGSSSPSTNPFGFIQPQYKHIHVHPAPVQTHSGSSSCEAPASAASPTSSGHSGLQDSPLHRWGQWYGTKQRCLTPAQGATEKRRHPATSLTQERSLRGNSRSQGYLTLPMTH